MNYRCRALRLGHYVVPPPSPRPARLTRGPLHLEPLHYLDDLLPNPFYVWSCIRDYEDLWLNLLLVYLKLRENRTRY
ncbi:unnamed protein product [Sphenostylis stenocarpa]|uniref:Uncharacterized protein n=1 Tax=Sphenostylis stenocarpa TaxID=92480 RepID=A0AA86STJ9_9FABA|nr:unnamed protein product [Sphenostylis stenocarpa]